jgi:PPM family protein phosphatase
MPVQLAVYARSDVGRVREKNEDAFAVSDLETGETLQTPATLKVRDRGVLMVVSDGMGGHAAGEVASAIVVDSLRSTLSDPSIDHSSLQRIIDTAVRRANADVLQAAQASRKKGMGATLTAVLIHDTDAYVAEVGDSRAYLLRGGRIRQITKDQSFVQMLLDAGVLTPEQAKEAPQKNVILQAMGLEPNVKVSIGRLKLRRGDRFLLCSDGVSNKLNEEELRALLANADLGSACSRAVDLANERGGDDNITTVVAEVTGEGLPEQIPDEPITQTLEVLQEFGDTARKKAAPAAPAPRAAPKPPAPAHSSMAPKIALGLVVFLAVAATLWWFLLR